MIEAVRHWLQQDIKGNVFNRVVFSSKANSALVEKFMLTAFPLYPSASRDSGSSFSDVQNQGVVEAATVELGSEDSQTSEDVVTAVQGNGKSANAAQNKVSKSNEEDSETSGVVQEEEPAKTGEISDVQIKVGDEEQEVEEDSNNLSTEDLLESLQVIQDENMRAFDEIAEQLAKPVSDPKPSVLRQSLTSPQPEISRSLPSNHASDFLRNREFFEARSASPSSRSCHSRSQSGDHILNPGRIESDV